MTVRAKFQCESVKDCHYAHTNEMAKEITLRPNYSSSEDNKEWSKWTPSGEVKMTVTNPAIENFFVPGKFYFMDFNEITE